MANVLKELTVQCGTELKHKLPNYPKVIVTSLVIGDQWADAMVSGIASDNDGNEFIVFGGGSIDLNFVDSPTGSRWSIDRMRTAFSRGIQVELSSRSEVLRTSILDTRLKSLEEEYPKPPVTVKNQNPKEI